MTLWIAYDIFDKCVKRRDLPHIIHKCTNPVVSYEVQCAVVSSRDFDNCFKTVTHYSRAQWRQSDSTKCKLQESPSQTCLDFTEKPKEMCPRTWYKIVENLKTSTFSKHAMNGNLLKVEYKLYTPRVVYPAYPTAQNIGLTRMSYTV